jgi:DNA-binding response OmpR family regulator
MNNFSISILNNKTFFQIIKEIKLFSKYKIKHYEDFNLCVKDAEKGNHLVVFFIKDSDEINKYDFPSILVVKSMNETNKLFNILNEQIKVPFSIFEFKKKIISAIAKNEFKKNSLINLKGYTIDKNERKIKKNNLELQLSEKEVDVLILFSESKNPIKKDSVLKKVWKYSQETETHTVETHIHRLRKKFLDKFDDKNFIKNNKKGYYV